MAIGECKSVGVARATRSDGTATASHTSYNKITYSYMDWFDGAEIDVSTDHVWQNIFSDYYETDAN